MKLTDYPEVNKLLAELCAKVRSKRYAADVRNEVLAHLNDAVSERTRSGLTERDAVLSAVADFGSPSDIGRDLNRVRNRLAELPLIWGLLLLIFITLNHYTFFGGHIGQMVEPKAFTITFVLALIGALLARRQMAWRSAARSLIVPARALSRRERVRAWFFFELFSRNIEGLSVGLGVVATIGTAVHAYFEPNTVGVWVATAWMGCFYGLVFGVLLGRMHAMSLRHIRQANGAGFLGRRASRMLSALIQGLAPILVIQALIGLISHVEVHAHEAILQGLMMIGYGFILSAIFVGLLPVESEQDLAVSGPSVVLSRLRHSALLYRATPLLAAISVTIILLVVWR